MHINAVIAGAQDNATSFHAVAAASVLEYTERGGGAFGIMHTGRKLTKQMKQDLLERGGLYISSKAISMKHIYLYPTLKPAGHKGYLRTNPHQATNQQLASITSKSAAVQLAGTHSQTQDIWLQRAVSLLRMSLVAEASFSGPTALSRVDSFLICLGLTLAEKDCFKGQRKQGKPFTILNMPSCTGGHAIPQRAIEIYVFSQHMTKYVATSTSSTVQKSSFQSQSPRAAFDPTTRDSH